MYGGDRHDPDGRERRRAWTWTLAILGVALAILPFFFAFRPVASISNPVLVAFVLLGLCTLVYLLVRYQTLLRSRGYLLFVVSWAGLVMVGVWQGGQPSDDDPSGTINSTSTPTHVARDKRTASPSPQATGQTSTGTVEQTQSSPLASRPDTPTLIAPSQAKTDSIIKVSGYGFAPNERVRVEVYFYELKDIQANEDGRFTEIEVNLPELETNDNGEYRYTLSAKGVTSEKEAVTPILITSKY